VLTNKIEEQKKKKGKNANHTYRQQADIHDSSTKPKRLNKKPTPLVLIALVKEMFIK
jgi:hypothetical protein